MSKTLLKKLLKKWIKILRLSSPKWEDITVNFGSEKQDTDMPIGYCVWSYEERNAQIYISSPKFYEEAYATPMTVEIAEKILIHELLHLTLQTGSTKNHQMFEQGINILADVLWEAHGEDV